jgi:spermidine/putrescine-binding protein
MWFWSTVWRFESFEGNDEREVDQLVDRLVWDQEAAGSSPVFPTKDAYSKFYKTFIWKKNNRILYFASVAQLVERLICNQNVAGSIPVGGSKLFSQHSEKS